MMLKNLSDSLKGNKILLTIHMSYINSNLQTPGTITILSLKIKLSIFIYTIFSFNSFVHSVKYIIIIIDRATIDFISL